MRARLSAVRRYLLSHQQSAFVGQGGCRCKSAGISDIAGHLRVYFPHWVLAQNTLGACLEMAWRPQPNRRPNWLTRPSCRLIRVCSGVRRLLRAVLTGAKSAIFRRCHWFGRAPCWPSDTSPFNISNKNIAWSPKTAVVAQRKKNVVVERQEKKFLQKQATMSFTPLTRTWRAFNPPTLEKRKDAIKFGILGAANSA